VIQEWSPAHYSTAFASFDTQRFMGPTYDQELDDNDYNGDESLVIKILIISTKSPLSVSHPPSFPVEI